MKAITHTHTYTHTHTLSVALFTPENGGFEATPPFGLSLRHPRRLKSPERPVTHNSTQLFFEQSENPRPVLICSESKNENRKIVPLC